ncbi:MAG: GNAT family N-acetyltransferase [Tepidisphaerales bacterium]
MPLPVLHQRSATSDEDLVRLFLQTDRRWAEHLAEPQVLDVGSVFCNPALPECAEANHVRDVGLPAGVSAEDAYRQVEAHFAANGARCVAWTLGAAGGESRTADSAVAVPPVSSPAESVKRDSASEGTGGTSFIRDTTEAASLARLLESKGYRLELMEVLALPHLPAGPLAERGDLQIIPARASFRHVRELFAEAEAELGRRQLGDIVEAHLDDPHLDALLAIKDGRAVGHAGIFGVGELARLGLFYVAPALRRQGAGRTLLSHMLEIARRALYRHIFAGVIQSKSELASLYQSVGMRKSGEVIWAISPRPSG